MAKKEEKLNPELHFYDIVGKTKAFVAGEITMEEFNEWSKDLKIRSSLPIMLKTAILINLMTDYYYDDDIPQESLIAKLYVNMFFHVYLGGYLGITGMAAEDINYENYDLLEPIFGPWIESFAERDIKTMKEMIFNNIQFYNSKLVADELSQLDTETMMKNTKANEDLVKYLQQDKELVSQLNSISILNNPDLVKLVNDIQQKAVAEAKAK